MNERRASDAAGASWRKFEGEDDLLARRIRPLESFVDGYHRAGPVCRSYEPHTHMSDGGIAYPSELLREEPGAPLVIFMAVVIVVGILCTAIGYAWGAGA